MAFTTFLVTLSMVAIASAGFPGWRGNDNPFPGFPSPMMMPSLRFGPLASPPSMLGMLNFPQNFPVFKFPAFPAMPTMSVADIANGVPPNGGSFNGVVISSKSEMKKKEDGTFVKEDGTTIMTNSNGAISVKKIGTNPPDLNTNPPPFDFNDPKFEKFNNFKKFEDCNNFGFHHTFAFIDPKKIETYKPVEDETFKGQSVRTHSFSTNINGKINEGGSAIRIDNDNGLVNKEKLAYNSDGTQN